MSTVQLERNAEKAKPNMTALQCIKITVLNSLYSTVQSIDSVHHAQMCSVELQLGIHDQLALPIYYLWLKVLLLVKDSHTVVPGGVLIHDGPIYLLADGASIVSVQ